MRNRTTRCNENGFFTLWVLGMCVCMLFVGGIALDLWHGFSEERQLAGIADASATAGAAQLDLNAFKATPSVVKLDSSAAPQRALVYIDQAAKRDRLKIQNRTAAVTDSRTTQGGRIEVTITAEVDSTLTRILRPGQKYQVTVHAASEPQIGA